MIRTLLWVAAMGTVAGLDAIGRAAGVAVKWWRNRGK